MAERGGSASGRTNRGRMAAMRVRRLLARIALVDEERDRRSDQGESIRRELAALEERLRAETRRMERENAAVLRLVAAPQKGSGAIGEATREDVKPKITRQALFQELERGSRDEVKAGAKAYVHHFQGRSPIVDLGCGRGEFLEIAQEAGLLAYGVDSDEDVVAVCRSLGLDARQEDLFDHLAGLKEESIGGVFCSQVVEHLPPELLPNLLAEIARVLQPGGAAVIETPNPATFATHVHSFWRDPTHIRPVPEAALGFAARTAGLVVESVVYTSPVPDDERLHTIETRTQDADIRAIVEGINRMTTRLNELLLGYQDYAMVAVKPGPVEPE
jgi:SAM-dependent methyltransferase